MWSEDAEGKILYVQTHGVDDPGRCATPFYLAAAGAVMECEVAIYFTMYGPQLLRNDVVDKIGPKGDRGQVPASASMDRARGRVPRPHCLPAGEDEIRAMS